MTVPSERTHAVLNTRNFLRSLLDPKQTPRVPRDIRRQASWLLKHYPAPFEMDRVGRLLPETWGRVP